MVKPKSPRAIAAAALAALVVGLSSCAAPQTLLPYTPANGVNIDAPRQGAADASEVPLKVRNLVVIAESDANVGLVSAAIIAPEGRDDRLISVEGRTFDQANQPTGRIAPVQANIDLPGGEMVILTEGQQVQLAGDLTPGLLVELKLTFQNSQEQVVQVPIMDGMGPDYKSVRPTPSPTPAPTTEAPPAPQPPG